VPRDTDDEPIRRHSKRQNPWLIPAVAGGVAFLLLCGILTTLMFMSGGSSRSGGDGGVGLPAALGGEPTAEREGVEWTTKQMAAHLKSRGLITECEVTSEEIDAKTPGGGRVQVRRHFGKLSAEDHAKSHDLDRQSGHHGSIVPSYQWGRFTCESDSYSEDYATPVFTKMRGAVMFTASYRRGQESGPKKVNP
jgi:hypothetical protein